MHREKKKLTQRQLTNNCKLYFFIYMITVAKTVMFYATEWFLLATHSILEKNLLFSLICIRFGTCKVRRLKRA